MYKFKLTDTATGETEIVEGNWPNQRDAAKFAVITSVLWNTAKEHRFPTHWDRCGIECELLEPLALRGPGRPKLDASDRTERFTVTLPSSLAVKAAELGNGNMSAGVRLAIEQA